MEHYECTWFTIRSLDNIPLLTTYGHTPAEYRITNWLKFDNFHRAPNFCIFAVSNKFQSQNLFPASIVITLFKVLLYIYLILKKRVFSLQLGYDKSSWTLLYLS